MIINPTVSTRYSLPPFRMNPEESLVIDEGLDGYIKIPTVHIVGSKDFVYEDSIVLHNICDPATRTLVIHDRGHNIPGDAKNVEKMAKAIRELTTKMLFL
jgi:Serine hydrolase (FSH1)